MKKVFHPYYRTTDWKDHIKAAMLDFADRFGIAPIAIRVNATELDTVSEALRALGAPVPVTANGGTLVGELELGRKV